MHWCGVGSVIVMSSLTISIPSLALVKHKHSHNEARKHDTATTITKHLQPAKATTRTRASSVTPAAIHIEKVGGRTPNWPLEASSIISTNGNSVRKSEIEQEDFDLDINRWLRSSRVVQWYPGHIAKAEKELKQQLKLMDVVIEVRDARIPMATGHPEMDLWIGNKKKIVVLNKVDMISTADKNAWAAYFSQQGLPVILANGQLGMGTMKLARVAKSLADNVNDKRGAKGLLPRATRAGVVGYPNVGKSSLINRLLKRKICATASRPGVTRELKWIRIGKDLDLLDSPGILPMRISDQAAATKLAICDDIGERSYEVAGVAAILVEILKKHPDAGTELLRNRYNIDADGYPGETYVKALAQRVFNGDVSQAAYRILYDFRKGKLGWVALERPPSIRRCSENENEQSTEVGRVEIHDDEDAEMNEIQSLHIDNILCCKMHHPLLNEITKDIFKMENQSPF